MEDDNTDPTDKESMSNDPGHPSTDLKLFEEAEKLIPSIVPEWSQHIPFLKAVNEFRVIMGKKDIVIDGIETAILILTKSVVILDDRYYTDPSFNFAKRLFLQKSTHWDDYLQDVKTSGDRCGDLHKVKQYQELINQKTSRNNRDRKELMKFINFVNMMAEYGYLINYYMDGCCLMFKIREFLDNKFKINPQYNDEMVLD